ncbi:MAG: hypothetical protein F4110_01910, partial [Acidimicrobiaceae bacterium]|nr:hypothetical protein [Acidimicrobiaceae bacterium]MYE75542.1 hypothetical protein [Acidimicrobiaceae bacterium]MYI52740.1 hypothetical protein [Acidimicrobiaceae bacterium]MYJ42824.1 hypothetical protein [Acidimicrobiaceae bacterium]
MDVTDAGHGMLIDAPATFTIGAGNTGQYLIRPKSDPGGTVSFTAASSRTDGATVPSSAVSFTSSDWRTPKPVVVTGVSPGIVTISLSVTSATADYPATLVLPTVRVTVAFLPVAWFSEAAYTAGEASARSEVTVSVGVFGDVLPGGFEATYALSGTATADDYSGRGSAVDHATMTGSVNVPEGSKSAEATFYVTDDCDDDDDETVVLTFPGALIRGTTTITIADDDDSARPEIGVRGGPAVAEGD